MDKQLKQFFMFSLLLVVLLYSISLILETGARYTPTGQMGKINRLMRHLEDKEVMIFGSSVAYFHLNADFIEKKTKHSTLNMGLEATSFLQSCGLIKEFLSYSVNCKYIVIAETYSSFGPTQKDKSYKVFPYLSNPIVYDCFNRIESEKAWRIQNIPLYQLIFYQDKQLLEDSFKGWQSLLYRNINFHEKEVKGFHGKYQFWTAEQDSINEATQPYLVDNMINEDVFEEFAALIKEINKREIKVILLLPPIYEEGQKKIISLDYIRNKFESLASRDVYFLDYTYNKICTDKSYFFTNTHLNKIGANKLSLEFSRDLNEIIKSDPGIQRVKLAGMVKPLKDDKSPGNNKN